MLFRKFTKNQCHETWEAYRVQRNKVNKLKRVSLNKHFDTKCNQTTNNPKIFWDTVKPFLNDKCPNSRTKINLLEGDSIIMDTESICNLFNQYFIDTALEVAQNATHTNSDSDTSFTNHVSVKAIRNAYQHISSFHFHTVSETVVFNKLKRINPKKATGYDQVPAKLVKLGALPVSKHSI